MRAFPLLAIAAFVACGCATPPPKTACPPCAEPVAVLPVAPPLQAADWPELPGWQDDDPRPAFEAFRASCPTLEKQALWHDTCVAAQALATTDASVVRTWFEAAFRPWALVNSDGSREGLITGYYEPVLRGSRNRKAPYFSPLYAPPDDLIVVDLADQIPELKHLRLRGRIEGRRLVPYYTRDEWSAQEADRSGKALLWIDDPLDLFFMEVQGSGQVVLDDGSRIRVGYADQNGHPYRSIGRWLVDQGEIRLEQASMQGIKAWAKANPKRLGELMGANPSLVFFRELPADGSGPPGALGIPLTPERSLAIDPRHVKLGAPVYLATTRPSSDETLNRLMVAQDTGGAIRGVVRADFFWGSGQAAGSLAGRMRQQGRLWVLMPRSHSPN